MKTFISTILCVVLAFPWAMKVGVTMDFIIRQDYIANNFCVNKDKPEMHCNGKCVLMKTLSLSEKKNEPISLPEISSLEIFSFLVEDFNLKIDMSQMAFGKRLIFYRDQFISFLYTHDIFHPPQS